MAEVPYTSGFQHTQRTVPPRVVLVDDHRLLAQMMVQGLAERGFRAVAVDVAEQGIADRVLGLEPDLVILDAVFNDDEDGGLRILRHLREVGKADRVVMLTGVADEVRHAEFLAEGARAVILKSDSFEGVIAQVESVLKGIDPMGVNRRHHLAERLREQRDAEDAQDAVLAALTDRERATLQALVDGRTVDDIALRRTVAMSTVRSQVRAVLAKLGAHSQIEAVAIAARAGMRPSEVD